MTAVGIFKMDVDNLRWLDASKDDADDLCVHGHAVAYIGKRRTNWIFSWAVLACTNGLQDMQGASVLYIDNTGLSHKFND